MIRKPFLFAIAFTLTVAVFSSCSPARGEEAPVVVPTVIDMKHMV